MSTLYISEYAGDMAMLNGQLMGVASEPAIAEQTVAIGGSSTQSAAFNAQTKYVRLHADATCSRKFGSNPTATATSPRMAAGQTAYYGVNPGDKVAVITNT